MLLRRTMVPQMVVLSRVSDAHSDIRVIGQAIVGASNKNERAAARADTDVVAVRRPGG